MTLKTVHCCYVGCTKKFKKTQYMEDHLRDKAHPGMQLKNQPLLSMSGEGDHPAEAQIHHKDNSAELEAPPPMAPTVQLHDIPVRTIAFVDAEKDEQTVDEACQVVKKDTCHLCKKPIITDENFPCCSQDCQTLDLSSRKNSPPPPTAELNVLVKGNRKKANKKHKKSIKIKKFRKKNADQIKAPFKCSFLYDGNTQGCCRTFQKCILLARHLRTKKGQRCIGPFYDEEARTKGIQRTQDGQQEFPEEILRQCPELVHHNWDFNLSSHSHPDQIPDCYASSNTLVTAMAGDIEPSSDYESQTQGTKSPDDDGLAKSLHGDSDHPFICGEIPDNRLRLVREEDESGLAREGHHLESVAKERAIDSKLCSLGSSLNELSLEAAFEKENSQFQRNLFSSGDLHTPKTDNWRTDWDNGAKTSLVCASAGDIRLSLKDDPEAMTLGLFPDWGNIRDKQADGHQSNGGPSKQHSTKSGYAHLPPRKRSRNRLSYSDSPGDGQEGGENKRQASDRTSTNRFSRFACPFYRRNPRKYQGRACAGPGFPTTSRVREHILRMHKRPIHCLRCRAIFETATELETHQRLPEICPIGNAELPEGYTEEQEEKLKTRRESKQTEEAHWKAMYRILFPDDTEASIPTPYYDTVTDCWENSQQELRKYDQYLSEELPLAAEFSLRENSAIASMPLENEFWDLFADAIREAHFSLTRAYWQSNYPISGNHTPSGSSFNFSSENVDTFPALTCPTTDITPSFPVADIATVADESVLRDTLADGTEQSAGESASGWSSAGFVEDGMSIDSIHNFINIGDWEVQDE